MRAKLSIAGCVTTGLILAAALVMAGCEGPPQRLNAPPQGQSDVPSDLQDNYVRMGDNALLNERSMSPVHFVSGSGELNSLGVRRLKRYATLLKVYGGELHYDGIEDKPELADQRVYQIQQYLLASGVGPDFVAVSVGCAGGSGMNAAESGDVRLGLTATPQTVREGQLRVLSDCGK